MCCCGSMVLVNTTLLQFFHWLLVLLLGTLNLGGTEIITCLMHVALEYCHGWWDIFLYKVDCNIWPCCELYLLDGLERGLINWYEQCGMVPRWQL